MKRALCLIALDTALLLAAAPARAQEPAPIVLAAPSALRLPPPPAVEPAQKVRVTPDRVTYWDAGWPGYRWTNLALDTLERKPLSNPRMTRVLAALHTALHDGMLAAWDSKAAYGRPRPEARASVRVPASPSYPDERAVAAGAASAVLAWAYPEEAAQLAIQAEEAAFSRVAGGVARPSDAAAGLELGRRVAAKVLERVEADGASAVWSGPVPSGAGLWNGTNPIEPLAGTWRPWVLARGSELRPAAPPAADSPRKAGDLAEIRDAKLTFAQRQRALYWQTFHGIFRTWYEDAGRLLLERRMDDDAIAAARLLAAMSLAHADASIACWDAKFTYWAARPAMLDASIAPLFPAPNHPSYPAAHGCYSGAIALVLARAFPEESARIEGKAEEAATSRIWAGVHFRSDVDSGLDLGREVAGRVLRRLEPAGGASGPARRNAAADWGRPVKRPS